MGEIYRQVLSCLAACLSTSEQTDLIMYSLVQMKWHGLLHHKLLYKRSHTNKHNLNRIFELGVLFGSLPSQS